MSQSQDTDQPMVLRGRHTEHRQSQQLRSSHQLALRRQDLC